MPWLAPEVVILSDVVSSSSNLVCMLLLIPNSVTAGELSPSMLLLLSFVVKIHRTDSSVFVSSIRNVRTPLYNRYTLIRLARHEPGVLREADDSVTEYFTVNQELSLIAVQRTTTKCNVRSWTSKRDWLRKAILFPCLG